MSWFARRDTHSVSNFRLPTVYLKYVEFAPFQVNLKHASFWANDQQVVSKYNNSSIYSFNVRLKDEIQFSLLFYQLQKHLTWISNSILLLHASLNDGGPTERERAEADALDKLCLSSVLFSDSFRYSIRHSRTSRRFAGLEVVSPASSIYWSILHWEPHSISQPLDAPEG